MPPDEPKYFKTINLEKNDIDFKKGTKIQVIVYNYVMCNK
jgi:hypothetical protein